MKKISYMLLALVLVVVGVNWLGWPYEVRFYLPHLNYVAFAVLCLLLPASMIFAAMVTENRPVRIGGVVLSTIVAVPSLLLAMFAGSDAVDTMQQGQDNSMTLLDQTPVTNKGTFRLYVTDCGATCSYSLVLRSEFDTTVGVKLVRHEWSMNKQKQAHLSYKAQVVQVIDGNKVLFEVSVN